MSGSTPRWYTVTISADEVGGSQDVSWWQYWQSPDPAMLQQELESCAEDDPARFIGDGWIEQGSGREIYYDSQSVRVWVDPFSGTETIEERLQEGRLIEHPDGSVEIL